MPLIPFPPRSEWPAHILEAHERWDSIYHLMQSHLNYNVRRLEYGEDNINLKPVRRKRRKPRDDEDWMTLLNYPDYNSDS